ncbi:SIR2 family protein [Actinophytocola glycyrrhizae]|uniref:SIR2 family protein n=1 Tax=Actinophytocola glycyrrhizae TaxID=2044873 RepID=A0ABV9S0V5_9PSEU
MTRPESSIVDPNTFVDGHTFSFQSQPYLRDLFEAVADGRLPLVLVLGAGVSMNASLPSWRSLITKMTGAIDDDALQRLAFQDTSDPMRKAEIILNLVKQGNVNVQDHEVIRDALYHKNATVVPGQLANSLARLIYTHRSHVKVLTTNFDDIIEKALYGYFDESRVHAYSISQVEPWREWARTSGNIGVMHLHGLVRQGQDPEEPIILTESQFLKYGARVRAAISDAIDGACTIFVGLSMSDPNLIGPLYESAGSSSPRFALVVPGKEPGASAAESARYAIGSARYLEEKLALRPIFLKSYSQLNQVISDLALASVEPGRYLAGGAATDSLTYDQRLARALDTCYSAIGCAADDWVPSGNAASDFNERLYQALNITGGPLDVLRRMSRLYRHPNLGGPDGENFGLSLWLRTRDRQATTESYSLCMVGTSAFTHREEWSMRRQVPISSDTPFTAAQAVFLGSRQAANVIPSPTSRLWRGVLAAPVLLVASGSDKNINGEPADILTIGAITLNSTHLVTGLDGEEEAGPEEFSIIKRLKAVHYDELVGSLQKAAEFVLNLA